ncbi:MAG: hypothetical protein ACLR0U_03720 [Enterocloster clostridioformis]
MSSNIISWSGLLTLSDERMSTAAALEEPVIPSALFIYGFLVVIALNHRVQYRQRASL